ncbi:hypothetical protein ElyMa_000517300 [Elysia marginata]|uniref:SEP domain-containing protein n=1 Tax=Elysia marginata TaxID=1093978 RepID=A0AAV4FZH5_9GAST|nr:hypothetical protein ElyMa_000517300 [Elysia marginata]
MEQDMLVENAMQYLSCVLTGRAAEFHASNTCHSPSCSLRDILDRLESRFGFRPERSYRYEEFQDAYQLPAHRRDDPRMGCPHLSSCILYFPFTE